MHNKYPTIRFLILVCLAVVFYSCEQSSPGKTEQTISHDDSLMLSEIEYFVAYGNFDSALNVIDSISEIDALKENKTFNLKLLENKARILLRIKRYQEALDIINFIITETENDRERYNNRYVGANLLKGDIYYGLGNYRTAYKYYYIGRESSIGQTEFCAYAMYDYRISLILYKQGKYYESANNFKKSFSKYDDCDKKDFWVKFRQQEIISNIGLCFYKLENYDSSLFYYEKALNFINNVKPITKSHFISKQVAEGVISGNMGKVYIAQQSFNKAIPLLKKNIEINSRINYDNLDALTSVVALANYYLSTNEYDKFNYILDLPKKYYENPNYKEQILYIYELKSKYYEKLTNYKLAHEYFKKFESIKDSLFYEKQKNTDSDVQLAIESLERENEFSKISKENQQRQFYIYIGIYVSAGLIILIITISIFLNLSNKEYCIKEIKQ